MPAHFSMAKRLFLVDGFAHCYQAFYAIKSLTGSDGEPVNAVYSFARMLKKIRRDFQPDYLAVVFDPPGKVFRHEIYEDYKATRKPMPGELQRQLPIIREMLRRQGIPVLVVEGYEADDVMGTAARQAAKQDVASVLVTTDKDAEQLIDGMTSVLHMHKDRQVLLDGQTLKQKEGIEPSQVVDVMALAGDPSDNVPGVPGIGPKTAARLISRFGSVENIYSNLDKVENESLRKRLTEHRDKAALSRRLVLIDSQVPFELDLEECRSDRQDSAELREFFHALGFRSLLDEDAPYQPSAPTLPARQGALFDGPAVETGEPVADIQTLKKDYKVIRDLAGVRELCGTLRRHAPFSLDLETTSLEPHQARIVGIALSWHPHQGVYVATAGPAGEKVCPVEEAIGVLKPILEDPDVGKIGQNLKYDMQVLKNYDVELRGIVCDAMIASYLLNPSEKGHGLDALALRHLNYMSIKITELIGEGRHQLTMDRVPVDRVAQYSCEDADVAYQLSRMLMEELAGQELLPLFRDLELPLIPVLASMEWHGVKIDESQLKDVSEEFDKELDELQELIFKAAGERFNLNSPRQLSLVLFERMKLPRVRGRTRTTGHSTDSQVLEEIARVHPIGKYLLRWRELSKLKGTYADALREMINPATGRLHTSFNQTGTATGRLSSSEPNLQNIPVRTPLGRRIRAAFVPGEPGMSLLSADYSQIELRVLAHCSEDETLQEAFRQGRDIHCFVAAQINGVPEEQVTSEMRQQAKAVNFGIIYGQSPYGLSRQIDVSVEEAERFIKSYFERYPKVKEFIGATVAEARRYGYVRTLAGRRRRVTGIRSTGAVRSAAERVAVNSVIQGSAADLIKKAMISIFSELPAVSSRSAMLIQIHDELLFEVPDEELEAVREFVTVRMSGAMVMDVPLKVETGAGKNWEAVK